MGRGEDEAVTGLPLEPFLHLIGHAFGRAGEAGKFTNGAAAADGDEIGQGRVLLARTRDHPVTDCLQALDAGQFLIGEGLIHPLGGKVVIQHLGEQGQAIHRLGQALDQRAFFCRLIGAGADNGINGGANPHLRRITARGGNLRLELSIDLLPCLEVGVDHEDQIAPLRGKAAPPPALPGLDQHRPALGRARHGEGALGIVPAALVIQPLHLGRVGKNPGFAVIDDGVVFPGIPMAEDNFQKFIGAVIAQIMRGVLGAAHIMRLTVVQRGDDIPGHAPAQHMIQRREDPGDVIGLVISGGVCGAQAEFFRGQPHGGEDGNEVQLHHPNAVAHRLGMVMAQYVRQGEPVIEEGHMEAGILQAAGNPLVILRLEKILHGLRVAPGAGIIRAILRLQKGDQRHLTVTGHQRAAQKSGVAVARKPMEIPPRPEMRAGLLRQGAAGAGHCQSGR